MSTLMSTDINLSRPSTRVRASPGGATTICFGDEHITSARPPMAPVAAVVVATKPIVVPPEGADICNRKCNIPHNPQWKSFPLRAPTYF